MESKDKAAKSDGESNSANILEARNAQIIGDRVILSDFINGGGPQEVDLESLRPLIESLAKGNFENGVVTYGDSESLITSEINPAAYIKIALALGNSQKNMDNN